MVLIAEVVHLVAMMEIAPIKMGPHEQKSTLNAALFYLCIQCMFIYTLQGAWNRIDESVSFKQTTSKSSLISC